ncbi:MAG: TonB-dependent receptor domain-containing protein [Steroidobacteraceae bacterium]
MSRTIGSRRGSAWIASILLSACPLIAAAQIRFNLPAEPLAQALQDLATEAGLNVYYDPSEVAGLKADALQADLTPKAAFARLLAGTRLVAVYVDSDTVRVVPKADAAEGLRNDSASGRARHALVSRRDSRTMSADDPPAAGRATGPHRSASRSEDNHRKAQATALKEVIVTGSRLPTTSKYTSQEVLIYNRKAIEQSGRNSIASFLSTLPQAPVESIESAFGLYGTVSLRGLPVGSTLVLLNGRRLEESGNSEGSVFDLNALPLAAVSKIEVDPTGSSAIYGSDAIGGVVNIILKKHFNGFAANVRYDWAKDLGNMRTSVAWGRQWRRGGLSVIASYGVDSGLSSADRLLTASNDYRRFGGPNNNYPVCFPGNVFSINGAPLPGAPPGTDATYAEVNGSATAGKPALSQFTYGTLHQCALLHGAGLLPASHREGLVMEGHIRIWKHTTVFAEIVYTHYTTSEIENYPLLFGTSGFQEFTVSAQNPYNPFGETVGVTESIPNIPAVADTATDFFRPLIGIKGTLDHRWHWEVSAWESRDLTDAVDSYSIPNNAAIQKALNSSNPATALNPFVDGPPASAAFLGTLLSSEVYKVMGRDESAEAFIRGRIARLPGGPLQAVVGGDYVRSTLYDNLVNDGVNPPNTRLNYGRQYSAVFVEGRVPVIGRIGRLTRHFMTLTLAGRHDDYSDFGSANTYQFGVKMEPTDSILLRGTYANAFDAPTLPELYSAQVSEQGLITNPVTGVRELIDLTGGGNPGLLPITGKSYTVGLVYASKAVPGMTLALTQWNVRENNMIQSLDSQVIVDNASSFPGRVITNAAGQIVAVNDTVANFGAIDVAGLDYQANYTRKLGPGKWSLGLNATETYRYRQALVAGAPPVESVSKAQDDGDWTPRWKGTISLGWSGRAVSAVMDGYYTGKYRDYDSLREIGNFWIVDANVRWALGHEFTDSDEYLRGTYVEAGATNLFNRGAQFSNFNNGFSGFDAAEMSIIGRSLYVQAGVHW